MIAGKISRRKKIEYIDIDQIVSGKFTVRKHFDPVKIERLAQSVKVFGILQPVTLRKFNKSYELISGERRVMAAKLAGLTKVPAMLIDARFDVAAAIAIAENQQREELYMMDAAESYMALIRRRGLTYSEMADLIGITAMEISENVMVLQLPKSIRDVLSDYPLTKEHLNAVSILDDEHEIAELLKKAAEENVAPEQLEIIAKTVYDEKRIRKQVVRDVKIFVNTINQAIEMIKKSGVFATSQKEENEHYIEYTIKIEK